MGFCTYLGMIQVLATIAGCVSASAGTDWGYAVMVGQEVNVVVEGVHVGAGTFTCQNGREPRFAVERDPRHPDRWLSSLYCATPTFYPSMWDHEHDGCEPVAEMHRFRDGWQARVECKIPDPPCPDGRTCPPTS